MSHLKAIQATLELRETYKTHYIFYIAYLDHISTSNDNSNTFDMQEKIVLQSRLRQHIWYSWVQDHIFGNNEIKSIVSVITSYTNDIFIRFDEIIGVHSRGNANYGTALNNGKLQQIAKVFNYQGFQNCSAAEFFCSALKNQKSAVELLPKSQHLNF